MVFEVGFGTGLNALLTLQRAQEPGQIIYYVAIEPSPLPEELINNLSFIPSFKPALQEAFFTMHQADFNELVILHPNFRFIKFKSTLQAFHSELETDLVYFDPFAPEKEAEVWTPKNLQKVYHLLKPGGLLVSYCTNAQFKRDLIALGMQVDCPTGRNEMTRGRK